MSNNLICVKRAWRLQLEIKNKIDCKREPHDLKVCTLSVIRKLSHYDFGMKDTVCGFVKMGKLKNSFPWTETEFKYGTWRGALIKKQLLASSQSAQQRLDPDEKQTE